MLSYECDDPHRTTHGNLSGSSGRLRDSRGGAVGVSGAPSDQQVQSLLGLTSGSVLCLRWLTESYTPLIYSPGSRTSVTLGAHKCPTHPMNENTNIWALPWAPDGRLVHWAGRARGVEGRVRGPERPARWVSAGLVHTVCVGCSVAAARHLSERWGAPTIGPRDPAGPCRCRRTHVSGGGWKSGFVAIIGRNAAYPQSKRIKHAWGGQPWPPGFFRSGWERSQAARAPWDPTALCCCAQAGR